MHGRLAVGITLIVWLGCGQLFAHPDLPLQIDHLTEQLASESRNTDLLLKRGDLFRRHGDWASGAADFQRIRTIDEDNVLVDWFEGRLLVDSGRNEEGEAMLTRFLARQPDHGAAYRVRAVARWRMQLPLKSAQDFQSAIDSSNRPSPGLYRSLVITLASSGPEHVASAMAAADAGLAKFSREVNLLGLAVDLSLSRGDPQRALRYLSRLPQPLNVLPQWAFRRAIWMCISGESDKASQAFSELFKVDPVSGRTRAGTFTMPSRTVADLAEHAEPSRCMDAAWQSLIDQNP